MSCIFGLQHRNDSPELDTEFELMKNALAHLPADRLNVHRQDATAIGHRQQFHTPEAKHEAFPLVSSCGRFSATGHVRLDNRDELLVLFNIPSTEWAQIPDSTLALRAYEHWGHDFAKHLAGDWAIAILNNSSQKLILARDATGMGTIFYAHQGGKFAFSANPKALLTLPWVDSSPNIDDIWGYTSIFGVLDPEMSFFKGVKVLLPASILSFSGETIQLRKYWQLSTDKRLVLKDDREYREAFLHEYERAVACRLRCTSSVGATLSGGLDSGSVVALAARQLKEKGLRLTTFSSVPAYDPSPNTPKGRTGDESPYIEALAALSGNIDLNLLSCSTSSLARSIQEVVDTTCQPQHAACHAYWLIELVRTAKKNGADVLLTGQGGNGSVSWAGSGDLKEYFDPRHLLRFLLWFAGHKRPAAKMLVKNLLPASIWQKMSKQVTLEDILSLSPLRQSIIDHQKLAAGWKQYQQTRHLSSARTRRGLVEITIAHANKHWALHGHSAGIEIRDPTQDKKLLELLFSFPEEQYLAKGESRRLIRQTMKSILPDKTLFAREKGLQSADLLPRLHHDQRNIAEQIEVIAEDALSQKILNLELMQKTFQHSLQTSSPEQQTTCASILFRGLAAGEFLLKFG